MRKPTPLARRIVTVGVGPAAILLAGAMVFQASNAAFSSSTRNPGNSWSTGSVALTDDDNGTAGFQVSNVTPGQTGAKCIVVTASSSVPGVVKAYVQNLSPSAQGLEKYIDLKIEQGTGGSFADCTGFVANSVPVLPAASLATLSTVNNDYATGGSPWTTTGNASGESKTYKGTWTFDASGLTQLEIDALQGASTSIDLVWELQNSN
ncbi:hypothetical protein E3T61_05520 [Cryobacterium lactosi]|uniref:Camelysin metallo-endopeptidase n=1 Tax=Cryobacterium lactosi TaxID=1259202 RepID=A0A4R9BXQ7_9MICO|nr:hypothetical protein [Cryobacterium lactosi]TFD93033.1 hypothetical protein E3T61_05520 [Cryobacterium lactosi]